MSQIKPIQPKSNLPIGGGWPSWFHPQGIKVVLSDETIKSGSLTLKSSKTTVKISKSKIQSGWIVEYSIIHGPESRTNGTIWMSTEDLQTAFCLSNVCDAEYGQDLIDSFGGDVAHYGKYIRYKSYLNMPGPGTGYDGDANISVCLDPEIKLAVEIFIQH